MGAGDRAGKRTTIYPRSLRPELESVMQAIAAAMREQAHQRLRDCGFIQRFEL